MRAGNSHPTGRRCGQPGAPWLKTAVLVILALGCAFSIFCTRHRTVTRIPRVTEAEKNERVFRTNEEAVKAGIYEEFTDSMQLKGQPSSAPKAAPKQSQPPLPPEPSVPAPERNLPGTVAPGAVIGFRVQLGAFVEQESAERLAAAAREKAGPYPVYVRYYAPLWKVQAGDCVSREEAETLRGFLRSRGYQDAWVVSSGINP